MPNLCSNYTEILGPTEEVNKIFGIILTEDEDSTYGLKNLWKISEELDDLEDIRSWKLDNWGNKWGDYDHHLDEKSLINNGDRTSVISFHYYTAWLPFNEVFWEKVSKDYPECTFSNRYDESMLNFAGAHVAKQGICFGVDVEINYDTEDEGVEDDNYFENFNEHVELLKLDCSLEAFDFLKAKLAES